jgi:hypothetical protein
MITWSNKSKAEALKKRAEEEAEIARLRGSTAKHH